ncbi:hypothetical protein ANN_10478 [Periplaneta americana]|uniref:Uncharacterized protein n=1 Tax=Periplaneta americana TaxID=6978 RepID=A0ABQ8TR04_PERAM|nr:hypothetical protein ANN_10478 [Periplaneta americana]
MQKAIKAFREGRSQRHAAELLGVPHSCLQRRLQSAQDNHLKSKGRQTTFTPEQENELVSRILKLLLRWAGHVARMGESRNAYRVLVGRPEGKRPLGRPRRRWEDNIKMHLREVGYDDREWINLAQDRDQWRAYVRAAMNLRQEDRDITYALFCSVLCIMELVLFDEILILSVEENPHVYDKQRASYEDEKMKENTWLLIAASLNTDRKAPCKADLNNFKGKIVPGRVSIPGPLVQRTSALPTELPGNSTRPRLHTQIVCTR